MREAVRSAGGGGVGETEPVVGVGGGGVCEAVGVGVCVRVDITVSGEVCVNVASGVLTDPDGWNGVGVGDAFGSCVMRMKVGMTGAVEVGEAQEERSVTSNT